MRRYRVTVAGTTYVIDVNELSAEAFEVSVGGRQFSVTLSAPEDVGELPVSPAMGHGEAPSTARFRPAAPETLGRMVPSAPPPLPPSPDRGAGGTRVVKAPMPGTITAVDVTAGARVKAGDVLLKLEAMKMVNAIKAPRAGLVAEVPARPGQSVGYGQPLVVFAEE
jgi:biotin carboxyl carrier protein